MAYNGGGGEGNPTPILIISVNDYYLRMEGNQLFAVFSDRTSLQLFNDYSSGIEWFLQTRHSIFAQVDDMGSRYVVELWNDVNGTADYRGIPVGGAVAAPSGYADTNHLPQRSIFFDENHLEKGFPSCDEMILISESPFRVQASVTWGKAAFDGTAVDAAYVDLKQVVIMQRNDETKFFFVEKVLWTMPSSTVDTDKIPDTTLMNAYFGNIVSLTRGIEKTGDKSRLVYYSDRWGKPLIFSDGYLFFSDRNPILSLNKDNWDMGILSDLINQDEDFFMFTQYNPRCVPGRYILKQDPIESSILHLADRVEHRVIVFQLTNATVDPIKIIWKLDLNQYVDSMLAAAGSASTFTITKSLYMIDLLPLSENRHIYLFNNGVVKIEGYITPTGSGASIMALDFGDSPIDITADSSLVALTRARFGEDYTQAPDGFDSMGALVGQFSSSLGDLVICCDRTESSGGFDLIAIDLDSSGTATDKVAREVASPDIMGGDEFHLEWSVDPNVPRYNRDFQFTMGNAQNNLSFLLLERYSALYYYTSMLETELRNTVVELDPAQGINSLYLKRSSYTIFNRMFHMGLRDTFIFTSVYDAIEPHYFPGSLATQGYPMIPPVNFQSTFVVKSEGELITELNDALVAGDPNLTDTSPVDPFPIIDMVAHPEALTRVRSFAFADTTSWLGGSAIEHMQGVIERYENTDANIGLTVSDGVDWIRSLPNVFLHYFASFATEYKLVNADGGFDYANKDFAIAKMETRNRASTIFLAKFINSESLNYLSRTRELWFLFNDHSGAYDGTAYADAKIPKAFLGTGFKFRLMEQMSVNSWADVIVSKSLSPRRIFTDGYYAAITIEKLIRMSFKLSDGTFTTIESSIAGTELFGVNIPEIPAEYTETQPLFSFLSFYENNFDSSSVVMMPLFVRNRFYVAWCLHTSEIVGTSGKKVVSTIFGVAEGPQMPFTVLSFDIIDASAGAQILISARTHAGLVENVIIPISDFLFPQAKKDPLDYMVFIRTRAKDSIFTNKQLEYAEFGGNYAKAPRFIPPTILHLRCNLSSRMYLTNQRW